MNKMVAALATAGGLLLCAAHVEAEPISGTLMLAGPASFTSNSITFRSTGDITGNSGAFTEMRTCAGCVVLNNFTSASSNFQVYSATNGSNTTTLTLYNITLFDFVMGVDLDTLTVKGSGTATLTGFEPTPAAFTLMARELFPNEATFRFSAITLATPVPEPSSLALLGTVLATFSWFCQRRSKSRPSRPASSRITSR